MSVRTGARCQARNESGGTCKRMTYKTGPYCWQHTIKKLGVQVKDSQMEGAGQGLIAKKEFDKGDDIVKYKGEVLTQDETDARYGRGVGPYTITSYYDRLKANRRITDARNTNSNVGRYANDCRPQDKRRGKCPGNNAIFVETATRENKNKPAVLEANKDIHPGQEIFTNYGSQYWNTRGPKRKRGRRH